MKQLDPRIILAVIILIITIALVQAVFNQDKLNEELRGYRELLRLKK